MPAVYLCNVTGDGLSPATAHRPNVPAGTLYACLMIHEAKARAIIVSPDNTLTGTGITKLVQGTDWANLRTLATTTSPTAPQLAAVNTWLTNNSYPVYTVPTPTWAQTIHYVARLVNPAADLDLTQVG